MNASYKVFLRSNNPEVKMLGILGNFGKEDSYDVVKSIISGIQINIKNDFANSRYFKQLRIFVQLRSGINHQFEKAMDTVTKFFKEENDCLYRRGEATKSSVIVPNLILEPGISDEHAARIAGVSLEYVKEMRDGLKNK